MSNANNSFDPRQAVEGLIGYVRDQVSGQMNRGTKPKPDSQKVEAAVLAALEAGPKTSSQIIKSISLASGGTWTPSEGDVNRMLNNLSEGKMVTVKTKGDRKVYSITKSGSEALADALKASSEAPKSNTPKSAANFNWISCDPSYLTAASKLPPVLLDVAQTGSKTQQAKAAAILDKARHDLHLILAEK